MGAADEEESEDELEGLDLMNKKNAQVRISDPSQRAVMHDAFNFPRVLFCRRGRK
jgi:hypothetical protein